MIISKAPLSTESRFSEIVVQLCKVCVVLLQLSGGQSLPEGAQSDRCSSKFVDAIRGLGESCV